MPLKFRKATLKDINPLLNLENQCFSTDALSRSSFRYFIKSGKNDLIVSIANKKVMVGYFLILYRKGGRNGRLYSLAVHPEWQGRGLGRIFIARIASKLKKRGHNVLILEVRGDNLSAISLYKKMGFDKILEIPNYYKDGMKALRFKKILNSI